MGVFNKTIIPLVLVGYETIISQLISNAHSWSKLNILRSTNLANKHVHLKFSHTTTYRYTEKENIQQASWSRCLVVVQEPTRKFHKPRQSQKDEDTIFLLTKQPWWMRDLLYRKGRGFRAGKTCCSNKQPAELRFPVYENQP